MRTAAAILTRPTFTLADRLKIQEQTKRDKNYIIIGRLTSVLFEARRDISGYSQSLPRYSNSGQEKYCADALKPFSEAQTKLWASITLDYLSHKNAPTIAISRDQKDLLLPHGLAPLPMIPDPRWIPSHTKYSCPKSLLNGCKHCVAPRIPQLLTGCPVVGDRIQDKITDRSGKPYGVLHPVLELAVMLNGNQGGFGRIRGGVDPADGSHLAMLIDDSDPDQLQAFFVGGKFQFGG